MKKLLNGIASMAANMGLASLVLFGTVRGVDGARGLSMLLIGVVAFVVFTGFSDESVRISAERYSPDLSFVRWFNRLTWLGISAVFAWHGFMFMAFSAMGVLILAVGRATLVRAEVSKLIAQETGHAA